MTMDSFPRVASLGVAVCGRQIGFCVSQPPEFLLDWWVTEISPAQPAQICHVISKTFDRYPIKELILENPNDLDCRLSAQSRATITQIKRCAETFGYTVRLNGRVELLNNNNSSSSNFWEAIDALSEKFPAIASRKPPRRKAWEKRHRDEVLFKAVALSVKHASF